MKDTRISMGMPIQVEIPAPSELGGASVQEGINMTFAYFNEIDERFSPFKETSEVAALNHGAGEQSDDMREILARAAAAHEATDGYFNIARPDGRIDPSGIVKGWAIRKAAERLLASGYEHFMLDVGGDIAVSGLNEAGKPWSVGIRNPFATSEIVKVLYPKGEGVATSGSYERGAHIYNPNAPEEKLEDIVSITVIGPDIERADVLATAAFAMGPDGVAYVESLPGFEAYAIDREGIATFTSGFPLYLLP